MFFHISSMKVTFSVLTLFFVTALIAQSSSGLAQNGKEITGRKPASFKVEYP